MSLVRKMQEGAKTPTLYTMYGKQYDFDELQRSADQGLAEHLAGLKRGSKDEAQFRDAYNNIMMGIRDGSITYLDGRFVDTKYGYHNSPDKDKNKDHYGLMANYIFGKMGRSPEYVKPEDRTKTKWDGSASIGNALIRELYNSDTENIRDFIDVDAYDETTKKRGTTNRAERLSQAFLNVLSNFDTLFTGYTDIDKANTTTYINDAIKYLNDGSIDAGDYLTLSRAASGLNYRGMFSEEYAPEQTITNPSTVSESPTQTLQQTFIDWVEQKYPQFSGTLQNPRSLATSKTYGPETLRALSTAMNGLSNNELYRIVRSALSDSKYTFNNEQFIRNTFKDADYGFLNAFGLLKALETLKGKGLLQSFGEDALNLYYIPNTDNSARQTAWVWDDQAGTVLEMSYHDIPYWREKIKQEWLTSNGGTPDNSYWSSRYFKAGGIIKAQHGIRFTDKADWYTGVYNALLSTILEKLKNDPEYYRWLNDMLDKHYNIYTAAGGNKNSWLDTAYKSNDVEAYLNLYKRGRENEFAENTGGYNLYGINNSYTLGMFDRFGPYIRTSGDWSGEDLANSWKTDGLYSGVTDFRRLLGRLGDYDDNQLKEAENTFRKAGYKFYLDPKTNYYKLNLLAEESPQNEKQVQPSLYDTDEPYDGSDFNEVTGGTESYTSPTKIDLTTGDKKKQSGTGEGFLNVLGGLAPDLIGAGRLAISLNTNNRVAKTIRPTLTPVLKNTYERFSPITGDLYTRQSGYRRAGDILSRFSRPLTSDASLYAHTMLEANRQAAALQSQADAADNQEIKRTAAEALARVEDNMARRSEIANFNRASMNLTNREIAQLEATRLKRNWQSWDNYLRGIEGRFRTKYDLDKDRRDNFRLTVAANDVENRFQERIKDANAQVEAWRAANPGVSVTTMPGYRQYEELIKEATRWKNAEIYAAHADIYGYDYTNPYANKSWADTALKFNFKKGGTLQPSALHLINKVIRNESNT